jgi:predicted nucleotidyltransferase
VNRKPATASGYSGAAGQLAQAASLYLATKPGDLQDEIVIVGGLVPSLIVPQSEAPGGRPLHVGTMDVDLGLAIAVLDRQRYHELAVRLRAAGFEPDSNEAGRPTSQRWRIELASRRATVDFLIPATLAEDRGGALRNFEEGFAAVITPGLELAFDDRRLVPLSGETLSGERARRDVWVCEAGAFIVLKALAFDGRGENKDAYDLVYVLQNYGSSLRDVFQRLQPLLASPAARRALAILERDFASLDSVGPRRVAEFLGDREDGVIRADAAGAARSLLRMCRDVPLPPRAGPD